MTMSAKALVAFATSYGSTQEVADQVAAVLRDYGLMVDVQPARQVRSLAEYDAVVLGAPLLMYNWHKDARRFLSRHRQALMDRPVTIFALGPVHDPHDEQEWQNSRAQLDKVLARYAWFNPIDDALFGGKYAPGKLRFPINLFAGAEPATDIRDWATINAWAGDMAAKLQTAAPSASDMV
jgi:menaquinone-dependent protoporphyrinogen oxidase